MVPPGCLSVLSAAVMAHLLHIYTNHTVVQQSGTFHSWGSKVIWLTLGPTQEHSIADKNSCMEIIVRIFSIVHKFEFGLFCIMKE